MNASFEQELAQLRVIYQQNLFAYSENLGRLWQLLKSAPDDDLLAELSVLAHRLAGSGKAYGFEVLSKVARDLEYACEAAGDAQSAMTTSQLAEPVGLLAACLDAHARKPSDGAGTQASQNENSVEQLSTKVRILVVDDDSDFCTHLCGFLRSNGYQVLSLDNVEGFAEALARFDPHAAIVDMDFYGKRYAGAKTVFAWRERNGKPIPVIFISAYDSFDLRLAAVRSGGNYFLKKPLNQHRLLSLINEELNLRSDEPYRVLIVDDDEDLLRLYQSTLVEAGYVVDTCSEATSALTKMKQVLPDMILLDVYMPDCDGIQLGQLIRQHEEFSHIPLLFMSAAADTDIKLACARLTNDEFINKPIEPWRLVMVVKARTARVGEQYSAGLRVSNQLQDPLTALPALKPFRQAVQLRLDALAPNEQLAVLKIDIRDFHTVNNLYGYFVGDQVLQRLAWELSQNLAADDLLCRESSDEFLVLTSRAESQGMIVKYAEQLNAAIERPIQSSDQRLVTLSADMGVAVGPVDAKDAEGLLRCADTALFAARKSSDNVIRFFGSRMRQEEISRFDLAQEIKYALQNNQFIAVYQPVFSVSDGALLGFEALARWMHPEKGQIGPNAFVHIMEEQGLVSSLTTQMLDLSLMQLVRWREHCPDLFMSVNLSAWDIQAPAFIDRLRGLLDRHNMAPESVVLEITETALLADWQCASTTLGALKALGTQLALDDFGTGYSSLSYLSRIQAAKLKIDRSFIHNWSLTKDARLLQSMIQLGHGMGMLIVAEGVETAEELSFLQTLGCDAYQGYLSAKPMLAEEVLETDWFKRRRYTSGQ